MTTTVNLLQSSFSQSSWTLNPFDADPVFTQSLQSTAEDWSEKTPEFQFNQSNWTRAVDLSIYNISSDQYCFIAFNGIVVFFLCAFGFLTSVVTMVGLRRDPEKDNVTIWLLKTLALTDCVHNSLLFVAKPMETISFYAAWTKAVWKVYYYISSALEPLYLIVHTLTVGIVVLVTVARYLCITRPMDTKWRNVERMKVTVIWLVILAALLNIPTFLHVPMNIYHIEKCTDGDLQVQSPEYNYRPITTLGLLDSENYTCLTIDRLKNAVWICYAVFDSVIGSFVPLIILTVLNLRIALVLRTLRKKRRQMSIQMTRERSLTKTLVAVVGAFAACQLPNALIYFIYIARYSLGYDDMYCALGVSNVLTVLNSPINFLIYCLFSKRFKPIFRDMFGPTCYERQRTDIAVIV